MWVRGSSAFLHSLDMHRHQNGHGGRNAWAGNWVALPGMDIMFGFGISLKVRSDLNLAAEEVDTCIHLSTFLWSYTGGMSCTREGIHFRGALLCGNIRRSLSSPICLFSAILSLRPFWCLAASEARWRWSNQICLFCAPEVGRCYSWNSNYQNRRR